MYSLLHLLRHLHYLAQVHWFASTVLTATLAVVAFALVRLIMLDSVESEG